jgi:hypothetical protein
MTGAELGGGKGGNAPLSWKFAPPKKLVSYVHLLN